jgi:glycosyltransferase involved in cell wall biosynthesis
MTYFNNGFLEKVLKINDFDEKKNWPKLSIVMPSFNHVRYIEKSILSILNQGYPNLQFIVIDGGSTDGTVGVIKKYSKYIDYWVSEKDNGQSDALNKGFKKANGEIYGWLNSDDLYLPRTFLYTIETLLKNENKLLVFGDWLTFDENDKVIDLNHAFDFSLNHFKYEGFHLNSQSMLWRSQLHSKFSGFDISLYNTMDYQMILEFGIIAEKKFLRIDRILGAFRRHKEQKTGSILSPKVLKEHLYLSKKFSYNDKYYFLGKLKRFFFRVRRTFWYLKRGGIKNLIKRINLSFHKT